MSCFTWTFIFCLWIITDGLTALGEVAGCLGECTSWCAGALHYTCRTLILVIVSQLGRACWEDLRIILARLCILRTHALKKEPIQTLFYCSVLSIFKANDIPMKKQPSRKKKCVRNMRKLMQWTCCRTCRQSVYIFECYPTKWDQNLWWLSIEALSERFWAPE